jgi:hypothetical protein
MHAVSDSPGLHACCVRIQGAEQDLKSVGQVVNAGHGLEGMPVKAGGHYRLRMRVQVRDLNVFNSGNSGLGSQGMPVTAGTLQRLQRLQIKPSVKQCDC